MFVCKNYKEVFAKRYFRSKLNIYVNQSKTFRFSYTAPSPKLFLPQHFSFSRNCYKHFLLPFSLKTSHFQTETTRRQFFHPCRNKDSPSSEKYLTFTFFPHSHPLSLASRSIFQTEREPDSNTITPFFPKYRNSQKLCKKEREIWRSSTAPERDMWMCTLVDKKKTRTFQRGWNRNESTSCTCRLLRAILSIIFNGCDGTWAWGYNWQVSGIVHVGK